MLKPGDLKQQSPRNKSKTMKFAQNSLFSGQNPPFWIFLAKFSQSAIELKCTELMKAKPNDVHQPLLRNRARSMKSVRKLSFFGPKIRHYGFFKKFFSQSKTLQQFGQNETNTKSISPFHPHKSL